MKRIALLLIALSLSATPALAVVYNSQLGYTADLPAGWEPLSRQELMANPDLLEEAFGRAEQNELGGAEGTMLSQVKESIKRGEVEYFYNPAHPDSVISVTRTTGNLPQDEAGVRSACADMPASLSQYAGRSVEVTECGPARLGNTNAMYIISNVFAGEKKNYQYELQRSPNEILVFTASCDIPDCLAVQQAFNRMIQSVNVGR